MKKQIAVLNATCYGICEWLVSVLLFLIRNFRKAISAKMYAYLDKAHCISFNIKMRNNTKVLLCSWDWAMSQSWTWTFTLRSRIGFNRNTVFQQQRPENVLPETSKFNKKNVAPAQEQMNALKDSWAGRQTSFCPSPPFIERMRCKTEESHSPTSELDNSHLNHFTKANVFYMFHVRSNCLFPSQWAHLLFNSPFNTLVPKLVSPLLTNVAFDWILGSIVDCTSR